ncbi:uncharacterized protein LOC115877199 [Sitophilus oryzae]|uniref:Uncharacterized protein LOC115877199 n=1 Tax=Sitophilus oryzae TaxID=7048 RepID=A0A6J2XD14_SITOR|nr:uncharacterized protein LOC115877199 [Sitophilus oryzae]
MEGSLKPPRGLILNGEKANWTKFKQQFDIYMKATGLENKADDRKIAIFMNIAGEEALDVFNTFKLSNQDKSDYTKVLEEFEKYCAPRKNIINESFKFFSRVQRPDEDFDHFLTELCVQAKLCEFQDQEERLIRDRIVIGTNDPLLQERMLREKNLTLTKAIAYCRASEAGKSHARRLQEKVEVAMIKKEIFNCKKCGKNHKIRECPAYGKKCAACKERNHFATMCHKARQERSEPQEKKSVERVKNKKRVNEVKEQEQEDIEEEKTFYLDTLVLGQLDKVSQLVNLNSSINSLQTEWYQKMKINKEFIQFKLDTGAESNTLPYNYFQKLNKNNSLNLKETKLILTSYSGNKFKPLGSVNLECKLNKKVNKVDFLVVDLNNAVPILGLESCLKFNLLKRVNEITSKETKEQFVSRNKDVFTGLGKIGKYKIKLIGEPEPIIKPIRRVPEAVSHKLKNTLEIMEKKGIIIKVNEPTEWCQNLVIVEKPDKSLRVCLDPKDLNRYIGRERYLIPSPEELCNRLAGKEVFSVLDMKDGFYQIELDEPSSYLCKSLRVCLKGSQFDDTLNLQREINHPDPNTVSDQPNEIINNSDRPTTRSGRVSKRPTYLKDYCA